jgi:uncharacterized protein YbaR (Trm112 family)
VFIELAEYLRCPQPHPDTFCVVAPEAMEGRMVLRGVVGCPICRREYPIADGVVHFGEAGEPESQSLAAGGTPPADPTAVAALLGIGGPGGLVVLVGRAVSLAPSLGALLEGVHFVGLNPPPAVTWSPALSLMVHPDQIPLKTSVARGVVLGVEAGDDRWWREGARVLLAGRRLVAITEQPVASELVQLASGAGLWVGEKRSRPLSSSR